MSGTNDDTLRAYEEHVQDYIDGTAQAVTGAVKDWVDAVLADSPVGARILELGSAFGRDAAYMAAKGYDVECTDAVAGFVSRLRARGFAARQLNVLTDPVDGPYDLIFANAVLLHLDRAECVAVIGKLRRALKDGGRLAFSLKQGHGEEWSDAKIGAPRFFCYWQRENLEPLLGRAGFARWTIDAVSTSRAHADWLFVTARA